MQGAFYFAIKRGDYIYTVRFGDSEVLHDVRIGRVVQNGEVTREVNSVNSFTFNIYENHPLYKRIQPMIKSLVSVYENREQIFIGRILKCEGDRCKTVTCEGILAFLNDVFYKFNSAQTLSVNDFIDTLINCVNNDRNNDRFRFAKGIITVSGSIKIENAEWKKVWAYFSEKLINELGGYLLPRIVGNTVYIDYLNEITDVCGQRVNVGENIISKKITDSGEEVASAIIAMAKGENSETDLTGASVGIFDESGNTLITGDFVHNLGKSYVYSVSAVEKYGFIAKTYEVTESVSADTLLIKAISYLNSLINCKKTYEFDIADLSKLNPSLPKIKEGQLIDVYDNTGNLQILCTKTVKNINNPTADKITLGAEIKYFTKG